MGDESIEALQGVATHLGNRLLAIGCAGRVAQIDDVLVGHEVDDGSGHRQPSESRVEDADR